MHGWVGGGGDACIPWFPCPDQPTIWSRTLLYLQAPRPWLMHGNCERFTWKSTNRSLAISHAGEGQWNRSARRSAAIGDDSRTRHLEHRVMTSICISTCICICIYICICMCLWQGILIQLSIEPWPAFASICIWRTHHLQLLRNGWEVTPPAHCTGQGMEAILIWKTFPNSSNLPFWKYFIKSGSSLCGIASGKYLQTNHISNWLDLHTLATTGIWKTGDSEKRLRVALWLQLHNERCSF